MIYPEWIADRLMNRINIAIILIALISCDPIDDRLEIINASSNTIYYTLTEFENLEQMYDHELAASGVSITYKNYVYELEENSSKRHIKTGSVKAWENHISKVCENSTLQVFMFDKDILLNHSWKEIVENRLFKERRSFSLDEIKDLHWKIVIE